MKLYFNRRNTAFAANAFRGHRGIDVFLASPFYTCHEVVQELLEAGCRVDLLVRLTRATPPDVLGRVIGHPKLRIKFTTGGSFHSKLYIFGTKYAVVGSANLTDAGLMTNEEICVHIPGESEAFGELSALFTSYWREASTLDREALAAYKRLFEEAPCPKDPLEEELKKKFGQVGPAGANVSRDKPSKQRRFVESFANNYQPFLNQYHLLEDLYSRRGRRADVPADIPLRLEVDQFLSYITAEHVRADGELINGQVRNGQDLSRHVMAYLDLWQETSWPYLTQEVPQSLDLLRAAFGDNGTDPDLGEMFHALYRCHAFRMAVNRNGGVEKQKVAFIRENERAHVYDVLRYLASSGEEAISRMAECIHLPERKIRWVADSTITEFVGWMNDNMPICNNRSRKGMRFLGFDIQVSEDARDHDAP